MKIRCDVCDTAAASLFCTADEAPLCETCDQRVHHANKLASKHQRFSLLNPSSKQSPVCDVCQERRAFLFCQEDRAIMCRDCDVPIHKANEHTKKHNRFLLTGVKISASSFLHKPSSSSFSSSGTLIERQDSSVVPGINSQSLNKKPASVSPALITNASSNKALKLTNMSGRESYDNLFAELPSISGWRVEDFLDSSSLPFGSSKGYDFAPSFMNETEIGRNSICSFPSEDLGIWVPQAPRTRLYRQNQHPSQSQVLGQIGLEEITEGYADASNVKLGDKRWVDDGFTAPQKRSRPFS